MKSISTDPIGEPVNEGMATFRLIDRAFKSWCQRRKLDEPELRRYTEEQVRRESARRNSRRKK